MKRKRICVFFILLLAFVNSSCKGQTRLTSGEMRSLNSNIVNVILNEKNDYETVACTVVDSICKENIDEKDYWRVSGIIRKKSINYSGNLPDFIYARGYIYRDSKGNDKFITEIKATSKIIKDGFFEINVLNENNTTVYTFYDRNFNINKPTDSYVTEFSLPSMNMNGMKVSFGKIYIINPTEDEIILNKKLDGNVILN